MKSISFFPATLQRSITTWAVVGIASFAWSLTAHGQATWTGATSADYAIGTNWSSGVVPTNGTAVIIDSSATNPTLVSGNWDRAPAGGGGSTTLTGTGSVTINSGQGRFFSNGVFDMSGGVLDQTGEYFIAGHLGVGTFNQSDGTIIANLRRGFFLSNNNANESGTTYNLSGGEMIVNSTTGGGVGPDLYSVWFGKGSAGVGTLVGDLFHATGGTATFTRTGTQQADVRISRNSKLQVSGGTVTFANYSHFYVGIDDAGSTSNSVIVDGGTLNITGGTDFYLGQQDDAQLTINSGDLILEGLLLLGGDGTGAFDGIGTVTMTGGNLTASAILNLNQLSFFNFSGGEITLSGDQTSIINENWFVGSAFAAYDPLNDKTTITAVPEPGTVGLVIGGLVGGLVILRRRRAH